MDGSPHGVHHNSISGDAQLTGLTIQARDVHGGVHLYAPPRPVPRQLPPVPGHFTNRTGDLAALDRLLARLPAGHGGSAAAVIPLIVVNGPAGIGKTALVSRWLSGRTADFPGGQLYADLRGHTAQGPAAPGEVLGRFLRSLGASCVPADLAEQTAEWRSQSAGMKVAVLLDNAFTAAQIRPLLPAGPGSVAVVTSRRRLTGLGLDGADFHRLQGFDAADGVELLALGIGADRVAGELADVQRVVDLCAGLPLAVCLASARLASRPQQPVASLAEALAPDADGLAALDVEGEVTVGKALDASYAVLDAEAALLYRRLGQLPLLTAFDTLTAAAACARTPRWAAQRLDALVEANLVEVAGPDTYRFHDLVRVHAQGLGAADDDPQVTLRRLCDWLLHTTTAAEQLLTPSQLVLPRNYVHPPDLPVPFADEPGAVQWLDAHRLDLMAATRQAADRGWHALAWQLADAMWPLFLRLRHYDLWVEAYDIGLAAARSDGNPRAERQMLNSGAIGLNAARRFDAAAARYEESLRAARTAGDSRDEGQALLGIGRCHREAGRPDAAVPYLRQAITVWEACGYPRGAALARTVLGELALTDGRPAQAAAHFAQAREALVAVNDPHDASRALAFLGRARALGGDHEGGAALMAEALAVFTASGATHWQGRALEMLGDSAHENGDHHGAVDLLTRALACYEITSPADARRVRGRVEEVRLPPGPGPEPGLLPGPGREPGLPPGPGREPGLPPGPGPEPGLPPGPGAEPGLPPGPGAEPWAAPAPGPVSEPGREPAPAPALGTEPGPGRGPDLDLD
ncbi:tetratricopeptide repeat protein [Actinacidiphila paucisporea]|uniref:Tetratricopeptide repeat-containing protein n=1 Tax=Actinacidiphila paucisporea TaxID=310782 RepID=A0A1M6YQK5_9ACTN|nr:tetratricopeptide repeat protein [Actinacidiphila paucisporea]SHL20594.1 Tetratricopeptide repeat-containing protein [Actinacidiphila paucisporea]